jgi:hypothetical protein
VNARCGESTSKQQLPLQKTSSFIAEDGNALTRTLVTAAMLAPAECAVAELAFVFWGVRVSKTLRS